MLSPFRYFEDSIRLNQTDVYKVDLPLEKLVKYHLLCTIYIFLFFFFIWSKHTYKRIEKKTRELDT